MRAFVSFSFAASKILSTDNTHHVIFQNYKIEWKGNAKSRAVCYFLLILETIDDLLETM